ncbi:MAG: alpha/beta fold hydrolase, partial [Bradyrhizobium sp.]
MFALTDQAARARKLRILAPERPGYGLSDYRRRQSLAQVAEDIEAFADALALDRFAIIGVSGGGPFAVAAAAAMPGRAVLLALVSPVGPITEHHRHIRLSKMHRLIFTRIGRSPPAIASFFWSLRSLVRFAPGVA